MRRLLLTLGLLAASSAAACSSEDGGGTDRSSTGSGGSGADAGTDAAAPQADPNQGRDDLPASCFAACSNADFSCQAKTASGTSVTTAELAPDSEGCSGTLTTASASGDTVVAMKVDCLARKVCLGSAAGQPATSCVAATYSATSFAYALSSGALNVCTRN